MHGQVDKNHMHARASPKSPMYLSGNSISSMVVIPEHHEKTLTNGGELNPRRELAG